MIRYQAQERAVFATAYRSWGQWFRRRYYLAAMARVDGHWLLDESNQVGE